MYEGLSEAQRSEGPCSREAAAYIFGKILKWIFGGSLNLRSKFLIRFLIKFLKGWEPTAGKGSQTFLLK